MNFRGIDEHTIGLSLDETTSETDVLEILNVFGGERISNFNPAALPRELDCHTPPRSRAPRAF